MSAPIVSRLENDGVVGVVRRRAAGPAVRVFVVLIFWMSATEIHASPVRHGRAAVARTRIAVRCVAGEGRPVVAALQRVDVVAIERRMHVERQLVGRVPIHVQPHVALALIVRLNAADFLRVVARDEIGRLRCAALHFRARTTGTDRS